MVLEREVKLYSLALPYSCVYNVPACTEGSVYMLGEYDSFNYIDALWLTGVEVSCGPCQWTLGKKNKSNACRLGLIIGIMHVCCNLTHTAARGQQTIQGFHEILPR